MEILMTAPNVRCGVWRLLAVPFLHVAKPRCRIRDEQFQGNLVRASLKVLSSARQAFCDN